MGRGLQTWAVLGEGVGTLVSALSPALPHPTPQLLKKIKRCERKGTESVTEEKCAVLFSTSFTLGSSKLPVQLQVRGGPGLPSPGPRPHVPHTEAWILISCDSHTCVWQVLLGQGEPRGRNRECMLGIIVWWKPMRLYPFYRPGCCFKNNTHILDFHSNIMR